MSTLQNRRILLIDDMPSIHDTFRKILATRPATADLDEDEAALFGTVAPAASDGFELDSAYQGREGLAQVEAALQAGLPYAMAFVDMRMPPGWDGVETIVQLWQKDPLLQIVICTAYSDYSWEEVLERLDVRDRLLILKKPFDNIEVWQLASTLTAKWHMTQQAALQMSSLEAAVQQRTLALRNEIAVRLQAEEQLKKLARARQLMAECNHVLLHASDESDLAHAMCRNAVEQGGFRMVWIGYAQHDAARSITPVAWAGFDAGYIDKLKVSWAEGDPRNGLAGTVIRTGQAMVVRNIATDPRFIFWREDAFERGYGSVLSLPLRGADGTAFGNLSIYAAELDRFDTVEATLLTELADDIAYGITSLRTAAARRQAEVALRLRDRAIESSINAILITDFSQPDNPVEYVNPAFERITGYSAAEVVGHNTRFLQRDDCDQPGLQDIHAALRELRDGHGVLRNYRKDGSLFWNDLHIAPVRDDGGRVTHFVGVINDITEARDYQQQLERHANFDTLTDLPNRNLLQDRIAQAIAHAHRSNEQLAVLSVDLDRFKFINDSFGHAAGDALLKEVAARFKAALRESDTVARLGGNEFVVMLQGLKQATEAGSVAQQLLLAIAHPFHVGDRQLHVTASIGVSIYPEDGVTGELLLKHADAAKYRARELGRDRYQFHTPEMSAQDQERMALENALRVALEQQQFELYYQPQVDLRSGQIRGVEALIRWHHPELGMISPLRFIPLAEETGLIVPIGDWVLRTACAQAKAWQIAGYPDLTMAVNVSARQFRQQDLAAIAARVIAETGLNTTCLELELTESLLMQDSEAVVEALRDIKAVGVTLALDDFGTGYSSFSYLKRFPIDFVKIDQSFIRDVTTDPGSASITKAIIAMAHSLGLKTIAEGVETEGQLGFLSANRCDAIQGYFFSRPLPATEIEALLRQGTRLSLDLLHRKQRQRTLLLVDDEAGIVEALKRLLCRDGYQILTAASGPDGMELLACNEVDVVISDQRMPGMSGIDFLRRVKDMYPDTVRIVLSGYTELQSITGAINEGAITKFLTKPWDDQHLRDSIAEVFRRKEMAEQKQGRKREVWHAHQE